MGGNTVGTRADLRFARRRVQDRGAWGRLREYLVYVPQKAKAAAQRGENVPLVFSMHGANMTMYSDVRLLSRWWEVADEEGFIAVFPTGLNNRNATSWATAVTSADMRFIKLLLYHDEGQLQRRCAPHLRGRAVRWLRDVAAVGRNLALLPELRSGRLYVVSVLIDEFCGRAASVLHDLWRI